MENEHEEHGHQEVEELVYTTDIHDHGGGLDSLLDVMFGFEHVVAEFFWNAVFILATFVFTKALAFRKVHKYIDAKHGVTHEEGY